MLNLSSPDFRTPERNLFYILLYNKNSQKSSFRVEKVHRQMLCYNRYKAKRQKGIEKVIEFC